MTDTSYRFSRALSSQLPLALLLEADPDEQQIQTYLPSCLAFAAECSERYVAAALFTSLGENDYELKNLSVEPELQGKGLGSKLLSFSIEQLRQQGAERISLGTGTFGYQLRFYQRLGFRMVRVERDYFLQHYPEPIFEDGLQHQDRLWLELKLED